MTTRATSASRTTPWGTVNFEDLGRSSIGTVALVLAGSSTTLPAAAVRFNQYETVNWGSLAAAAVIMAVPVVIVTLSNATPAGLRPGHGQRQRLRHELVPGLVEEERT